MMSDDNKFVELSQFQCLYTILHVDYELTVDALKSCGNLIFFTSSQTSPRSATPQTTPRAATPLVEFPLEFKKILETILELSKSMLEFKF